MQYIESEQDMCGSITY